MKWRFFFLFSLLILILKSSVGLAQLQNTCQTSSAAELKRIAMLRLSPEVQSLANDYRRLQTIEQAALVLHSTSGAYGEQYLKDERMRWLGVAAHAMNVVAQFLEKLAEDPRTFGNRRVAVALAIGNLAVYQDLFWQFLYTSNCGPQDLLQLLMRDPTALSSIGRTDKFSRAWRLLQSGSLSEAALAMGRIEQEEILQPTIYDGMLPYFGGFIFRSSATIPLPGYIKAQDFKSYTSSQNLFPNFAVFETRWSWMKTTMIEILKFMESKPEVNRMLIKTVPEARDRYLQKIRAKRNTLSP